jgi:diguanylate cyclase (GGDEF)-like protein/PAS domain S-box-containing protein
VVSRGLVVESGPELRARQQLRIAERLSRVVVDGLEEGVVVTDASLKAVSWNASALRILGVDGTDGDRPFADLRALALPDGTPVDPAESPLHEAQSSGEPVHATLRTGERWMTLLARPLGRAGTPAGVVCTLDDVTESVHAEQRLTEERDRAERYLEVASTIVVVLDFHGRIERINGQGCELLGFREGELIGEDWFQTVIPQHERLQARQAYVRLVSEVEPPRDSLETFVRTKDGEDRKIAWRNAVLHDGEGNVVSVLRSGADVTERRAAEAQVEYLAYHDALTGLANRAQLERQLGRDIARARRAGTALALLYFDLDNFKLVNDSLGHTAGDAVLREAAERVSAFVRAGDMLARQGGDEFLLLLDCGGTADPREAAATAGQRIADALESPMSVAGAVFHVGASIGIAVYPEHAEDGTELLKHADQAMYQAKRAGGGDVAFYEAPTDDARRRLSMTTRLRRAIGEDELVLFYQPIFSVENTATPSGYEALVRWIDPDEGMIPPDRFIGVAEESGLIEELGRWVVDAACRQVAEWGLAGYRPQMSFNLSPRELRRGDLASTIGATIATYRLDARQFTAELTETAIMSDQRRHTSLIDELNEIGLTVAIDDFGSGHSSLGRLRDLPVQVLKVDRSFLRRVPSDHSASAIVSAVLTLSNALGMATVVEGVEDDDQLRFLRAGGATHLQGFLLGRPAPADQIEVPQESPA